jgi:cell division septal protein FtsQ
MKSYRKPYRIRKKTFFLFRLFHLLKSPFFWLSILIFSFFLAISYFLFYSSIFQIKDFEISGNREIPTDQIKNFLINQTTKKFLFFPTQSIFLINSKKLNELFFVNFPQIKEIKIKRKLPEKIAVFIKEREAQFSFCQEKDKEKECFFVDEKGIIFKKISLTETKNFPLIELQSQKEFKLAQKILGEREISFLSQIKDNLRNFKIDVLHFSLEEGKNKVLVKTGEGWDIYFNLGEDLSWQLTKLRIVLEKQIPLERKNDLEYIDLRFGNFANFKYRKEKEKQEEINQNNKEK